MRLMATPHPTARGRIADVTGGAGTIATTITKALRENRTPYSPSLTATWGFPGARTVVRWARSKFER